MSTPGLNADIGFEFLTLFELQPVKEGLAPEFIDVTLASEDGELSVLQGG